MTSFEREHQPVVRHRLQQDEAKKQGTKADVLHDIARNGEARVVEGAEGGLESAKAAESLFKKIARRTLLLMLLWAACLSIHSMSLEPPEGTHQDAAGKGCSNPKESLHVGVFTGQISSQAVQAYDLFTSILALSNPAALGLNHLEIWELAVAVEVSHGMPNKGELGERLAEFGDQVRDVKDAMQDLHAEGMTVFRSTLYRFKRLEKVVERLQIDPRKYTASELKVHLDDLFDHVDRALSKLLRSVEKALPLAAEASEESGEIREALGGEERQLKLAKDNQPFWRLLLNPAHGRRLREDLKLTGMSIRAVVDLRQKLEATRSFIRSYRSQVGYFKSSFAGFHHGDHGLHPEDEALFLQDIMKKFEESVKSMKHAGTAGRVKEPENAPWKARGIAAK